MQYTRRLGHRTEVMSVAYTRDGKAVASTGGARLNRAAGTGKLRKTGGERGRGAEGGRE